MIELTINIACYAIIFAASVVFLAAIISTGSNDFLSDCKTSLAAHFILALFSLIMICLVYAINRVLL